MPQNYARSKSGLSDSVYETVHEYRRYLWNIAAELYSTQEQEDHLRSKAKELEVRVRNSGLNPSDYQEDLTVSALVSPKELREETFRRDIKNINSYMEENLFINMKKHTYISRSVFGRIFEHEPLTVVINDKFDYQERTREVFNSLEDMLEIWTVD